MNVVLSEHIRRPPRCAHDDQFAAPMPTVAERLREAAEALEHAMQLLDVLPEVHGMLPTMGVELPPMSAIRGVKPDHLRSLIEAPPGAGVGGSRLRILV